MALTRRKIDQIGRLMGQWEHYVKDCMRNGHPRAEVLDYSGHPNSFFANMGCPDCKTSYQRAAELDEIFDWFDKIRPHINLN